MISQICAISIFILMFFTIITDKIERHITTLISGFLVFFLVFGLCMKDLNLIWSTLNFSSLTNLSFWYGHSSETISGINWSTIIFITGMMIMVEGMAKSGAFKWLCLSMAKLVKYKTIPLFICFLFISAFLSMFIDSITVILFLSAVTVELSHVLKFNPVPIIIAEIFCANLGGAATMCGDPPNIIIGTSLGLTFFDFLSNTGFIAFICFICMLVFFLICFKKDLKSNISEDCSKIKYPEPWSVVNNKKYFIFSLIIFLLSVILLITHSFTGLTVNCIGMIVAILMLVVTGIVSKKDLKLILKDVDWKTILFFIGLFITVSGLEETGVLELLAKFIGDISNGNAMVMILIILWLSALASAIVDNIPFAATMVPVIQSISTLHGIDIQTLAWTLSLGTDFGGNATPIGASANVVGTSIAQKNGYPISWKDYCKYCIPATLIVLILSSIYLIMFYV